MADLSETIETVAQVPAATTADGATTTEQPLPDLIAADNHLAGKTAVAGTADGGGPKSPFRCLRMGRAIPPNATGY